MQRYLKSNQDTYVLVLRTYLKEGHEESIRSFLNFLSQLALDNSVYFVLREYDDTFSVKVGLKCLVKDQVILRDLGYAVSWFVNKEEDLKKMGYKLYSKRNGSR